MAKALDKCEFQIRTDISEHMQQYVRDMMRDKGYSLYEMYTYKCPITGEHPMRYYINKIE